MPVGTIPIMIAPSALAIQSEPTVTRMKTRSLHVARRSHHPRLRRQRPVPAAIMSLSMPDGTQDSPTSFSTAPANVFDFGGTLIWKTANTATDAEFIRTRAGGATELIACAGSDMPQCSSVSFRRTLALCHPAADAATRHIEQISSLIPTLSDAAAHDLPVSHGAIANKLSPARHRRPHCRLLPGNARIPTELPDHSRVRRCPSFESPDVRQPTYD